LARHAREVLAGGAGLLVPHRDPAAIATALRSVVARREGDPTLYTPWAQRHEHQLLLYAGLTVPG
jgi:hypothetical protein